MNVLAMEQELQAPTMGEIGSYSAGNLMPLHRLYGTDAGHSKISASKQGGRT